MVNGSPGTGHLVTLVERATRFTCIRHVATKKDDEVAAAVVAHHAVADFVGLPLPGVVGLGEVDVESKVLFDSFELRELLAVVERQRFQQPWGQRSQTRKVLPKGTSFLDIADEDLRKIDALLNDRPLRCLKWRTPREAFAELLKGGPGAA